MTTFRSVDSMRALALAIALVACSNSSEPPSRSVPTTSASPTPATTQSERLEAKNECISAPDRVAFQVLIPVHYSALGDGGPRDKRTLYTLSCEFESHGCIGAYLRLDNADVGKPIGFFDLGSVVGAEIVDHTGAVFTVKWGFYRTFTVDLAREAVTYVESAHNTQGRGEVPCKLTGALP